MSIAARVLISLAVAAVVAPVVTQVASDLPTGHDEAGIVGLAAPAWSDVAWLGDDARRLEVTDFRGKVLYLYGFQSWCPGCHSRGFPTLAALEERYRDADDVAFIAIQTVFEGFGTNTQARGLEVARSFVADVPVGHSGAPDAPSAFMASYRTAGTPWAIVIDKRGVVRFNDFHVTEELGAAWIDRLRAEEPIVGAPLPRPTFDAWWGGEPVPLGGDDAPRATLYRWWTIGCPFCETSLPELDAIAERYADRGVRVVGVFHPKPRVARLDDLDRDAVVAAARDLGFDGTLAVDVDHSELRRLYLDRDTTARATSVTILVDAEGVVRHVDRGPVLERASAGATSAIELALRDVLSSD